MFAYAKPKQEQTPKSTIQKKEPDKKAAFPNKTCTPNPTKLRFGNHSGSSFDDVRVHNNSDKPTQLQALTYTQGAQTNIAPGGQPAPITQFIKLNEVDYRVNEHIDEIIAEIQRSEQFNKYLDSKVKKTPNIKEFNTVANIRDALTQCTNDIDSNGRSFPTLKNIVDAYLAGKIASYLETIAKKIPAITIGDTKATYAKFNDIPGLLDDLKSDSIFKKVIEENIGKPPDDEYFAGIGNRKTSELKIMNFYSKEALKDEVKRLIISSSIPTTTAKKSEEQTSLREDNPYKLSFGKTPYEKGMANAYSDASLHHVVPLSKITIDKRAETPEISAEELSKHQWNPENLVIGPDRGARIYEPGNAFDVEADTIKKRSQSFRQIDLKDSSQESTDDPIYATTETSGAHMKTNMLQSFYSMCQAAMKSDHPGRSLSRNRLVPFVDAMIPRFSYIETAYEPVVPALKTFRESFVRNAKEDTKRDTDIDTVITAIKSFGEAKDTPKQTAS